MAIPLKQWSRLDRLHFDGAEGWLGLGDWVSANSELDEMTPELRAHPAVLLVRCDIYAAAKKWNDLLAIAETLVKISPNERQGWTHRSMAMHRSNRTQEAFDLLLPARKRFPKAWLVPYRLACYASCLGLIQEAQDWFKKAMELNEQHVKQIALDDPDLEPLWTGMQGTNWKRAK